MADEIMKKYVDREGLNKFLEKLKSSYASNSATKFAVNYAATAGEANTVKGSLTIKDSEGNVLLNTWKGAGDAEVTISGGSAPISVEGVLKFKGGITNDDLKALSAKSSGDVYTIIAGGADTTYPVNSEVVWYQEEGAAEGEWIELGPAFDTDNLVTDDELTATLATYATKAEIADFVTGSTVDTKISTALADYLTSQETEDLVDTKLNGYATVEALDAYTDATELADAINGAKADIAQEYLTQADAASTYATKSEVAQDYLSKTDAASTYATKSEVAQDYLSKADAASTYATKAELADDKAELEGDISDLDAKFNDYALKTDLDDYALKTDLDDYATKAELSEHAEEADEKYVHQENYTTYADINKMFPVDYDGNSPEALKTALDDLGEGGALNIDKEVTMPTTGVYGYVVGKSDGSETSDIKINLGSDGSIVAESGARIMSVNPGSNVEIVGDAETKPAVTSTADEPAIFIANNASVTLEGVTLSGKNYSALQSNGLNENSDFYIKNCVIYGPCYMPACGNLVIENCEFHASDNTSADAGALYVKSGSITIRNSKFYGDTVEHAGISGPWKHNNNGWNGIATALVLENCNYGGHGNLTIDIDAASQFFPGYCDTTAEAGKQYDNVGILVINYKGNHCAEGDCNIAQNYYEIDVTESTIGKHYFTLDGRGGTEQLTLRVPN